MARDRRFSTHRNLRFDVLEDRAILSVVSPASELYALRQTHPTIIQGTIHGEFSQTTDSTDLTVIDNAYSGRGTASHLGQVGYSGFDVIPTIVHLNGLFNGDATLTTTGGDVLAMSYNGRGLSQQSSVYLVTGNVLGSRSTGSFAQDSGTLSGRAVIHHTSERLKFTLKFTIKLNNGISGK